MRYLCHITTQSCACLIPLPLCKPLVKLYYRMHIPTRNKIKHIPIQTYMSLNDNTKQSEPTTLIIVLPMSNTFYTQYPHSSPRELYRVGQIAFFVVNTMDLLNTYRLHLEWCYIFMSVSIKVTWVKIHPSNGPHWFIIEYIHSRKSLVLMMHFLKYILRNGRL